jgi:hypothetical protein
MTASEALRQYFKLAGKIFSKKNTKPKGKEGSFKASTSRNMFKKLWSITRRSMVVVHVYYRVEITRPEQKGMSRIHISACIRFNSHG